MNRNKVWWQIKSDIGSGENHLNDNASSETSLIDMAVGTDRIWLRGQIYLYSL